MGSILVAYATKHGSTAEIAEAIGADLRERGHAVDVTSAHDVHDVSTYDAVVVGSAVYLGHWQKDALQRPDRRQRGGGRGRQAGPRLSNPGPAPQGGGAACRADRCA